MTRRRVQGESPKSGRLDSWTSKMGDQEGGERIAEAYAGADSDTDDRVSSAVYTQMCRSGI